MVIITIIKVVMDCRAAVQQPTVDGREIAKEKLLDSRSPSMMVPSIDHLPHISILFLFLCRQALCST